jgi:thiamine biosynthesis lipoprotein
MKRLRLIAAAIVALCVAGCGDSPPATYQQQLLAFGTLVDISVYDIEPEAARQAVQAVEQLFIQQNKDWHAWQRGELDSLNQALAAGRNMETDTAIIRLIEMGQRFERLSHGLFNPAIGHLLKLWGFQQDEPGKSPPDADSIRRWVQAAPSTLQVHIDGSRVSSTNPAVKLDFGGFAKGYSVATAVDLLERRGIDNLIVNAGGDLCLRGRHGERPWRIGIRSPEGSGVLASLDLEGARCVFTSGDYERYFEYRGKRYGHILDPRSGYPAEGVRSVTVMANDAALADAAATALFVAGVQGWQAIARSLSIRDVLLIDTAGDAYITDTLKPLVHFEQTPRHVYTVDLNSRNES